MYFMFYKMLDNDNINTMLGEIEKYCDIVYVKWHNIIWTLNMIILYCKTLKWSLKNQSKDIGVESQWKK